MSIICGTDLSAASAGALDVALAIGTLYGDRDVVLVHVVDPELGGGTARERALADARAQLEQLTARERPRQVKAQVHDGDAFQRPHGG